MRPIVFGFTLAALLFVVSQAANDSIAHNDNDGNHGQGGATHYAHCDDGHHARRLYDNYSENFLYIKSRFFGEVPAEYQDAYYYAAVYWNAQGTRVIHTPGSQGFNNWRTYDNGADQAWGFTTAACFHFAGLHRLVASNVFLNRAHLDGLLARQRTTALHEVGHETALGHSMQTVGGAALALMYPAALPHLYQTPQLDDVCGVNAIYRSNTYPVSQNCHADHFIPP